MQKRFVIVAVIAFLASGCMIFKEELPISTEPYLKNYEIALAKDKKDHSDVKDEGIYEPPPSYPENVAHKNVIGFDEYVVGPTDELVIVTWKGSEKKVSPITIRPDGKISYSFLEDMYVTGMTPTEVDDLITSKVKDFLKNPKLDLMVKNYRHKQVALSGPIKSVQGRKTGPGIYPLTGRITLLDQLLQAGGVKDDVADLTRVKLTRMGKTYIVNVADMMKSSTTAAPDIVLEAGDIIVVPEFKRLEIKKLDPNIVYVFGEVKREGIFKLPGKLNILDVIGGVGGFKKNAKKNDVKILRGDLGDPVILKSDVKRLLKKNDLTQLLSVQNGDVIYVASTLLGKIDNFSLKVKELLNLAQKPAIYRDLYTTGGWGRIDTGEPITGIDDDEFGAQGAGGSSSQIGSVDLLIRGE